MLASLFQVLDKRPVKKEGGFLIPYTVLLEGGQVSQAYRVWGDPHHTGGQGLNATTTSGGAGSSNNKTDPYIGCLRKEYDIAMNTVRLHLGLEEEAVVRDVGKKLRRETGNPAVKTMLVEKLQRREYAFDGNQGNTLHVEYLTDRYSHNLLARGDPTIDPIHPDTVDALKAIEQENARRFRHRTTSDVPAEGKTGLLQVIVPSSGDHNETIRVVFESHTPTGGSFPEHAQCRITSRRNIYPQTSRRHFGYERMCTFDGPKLLTEDTTTELTEETRSRVLQATKFVLASITDVLKKYVAIAVFLFKLGTDGQLYLCFAPHIGMHTGDGSKVQKPPSFKIPTQYVSMLRRPKPTAALANEEDLVDLPVLEFSPRRDHDATDEEGHVSPEKKQDQEWLDGLLSGDTTGPGSPPGGEGSAGGGVGGSPGSPKRAIDYDRIMVAFESMFPAPIPAHAAERLKANRRAAGEPSFTEIKHRSSAGSPSGHHPRENPQPSQDALRRRWQCTTVNNVRSLLSVLEGQRGLSKRLTESFNLTKEERKFLNETAAQAKRHNRPHHGHESSLRDEPTPLKRPASRAKTPSHMLKPKPDFRVVLEPSSGFFDKAGMRHGPKVGRPPPLKPTKLRPVWSTENGQRPKLISADEVKKRRRNKIREQFRKEREEQQRLEDEEREDVENAHVVLTPDGDSELGTPRSSGGRSHGTQSVRSHALDFPELSGFALPKTAMDQTDTYADDLDRLLDVSGGATHVSGRAMIENRLKVIVEGLDTELQELRPKVESIPIEDKIEYMLTHPDHSGAALLAHCQATGMTHVDALNDRLVHLQDTCRKAMDYLYGLCYHLTSRSLSTREGSKLPEGSRLIFSIPPRELGHYEKKLTSFLSHQSYLEQMNTEENIGELQMLLIGGTRGTSTGCQAFSDASYAAHLEPGANIAAVATFSIKKFPPKFELQSQVNHFLLGPLRYSHLEKIEELLDEYMMSPAAPGSSRPQSPIQFLQVRSTTPLS